MGDWVAEMEKLVKAHPTLTWIKPKVRYGPHMATWDDDEGSHREQRERLGELVQYLQARLRP